MLAALKGYVRDFEQDEDLEAVVVADLPPRQPGHTGVLPRDLRIPADSCLRRRSDRRGRSADRGEAGINGPVIRAGDAVHSQVFLHPGGEIAAVRDTVRRQTLPL